MSEQVLWAASCFAFGLGIGFFVCCLLCEGEAEARFDDGFELGRRLGMLEHHLELKEQTGGSDGDR